MRILKERHGQYYGIKSVKLTEQEMINLDGHSVKVKSDSVEVTVDMIKEVYNGS